MSGPGLPTYLAEELGELPFCPGCGHEVVVKALNDAFVKLQVDPTKTVIVTDIGCIGLTCKYFKTSAFHGLHGRSITYGCGLKLARPELTVVVVKGDGACGIGGTHLLNVARRNIGIKLIVANNFNYGMTGGQHSVTTPSGGLTSTTPWGNVEAPMDLCATAVAAGAAWVRRATAFDRDLPDTIAQAIRQPGFAMLDIWELCTAYYMPRNDLKKKGLFELLDRYGLTLGQQVDKPRPEYTEQYRTVYQAGKSAVKRRPRIERAFSSALDRQTGIIIAGSAGEKVKTAATLFGQGGMFAGLSATQKDDYPITVQTGHSVGEIILSPERIDYHGLDVADHVLLVSENGLARVRHKLVALPATSVVYAEQTLELPKLNARVLRFPFAAAAKKISRLAIVMIGLGALLERSGLYPIDALLKAITTFQSPKVAESNRTALDAGVELARTAGG